MFKIHIGTDGTAKVGGKPGRIDNWVLFRGADGVWD